MLHLNRRIREGICIGDDIYVVILGVSGDQVRLGIAAPREISVHRQEVWFRIQNELKTDNTMGEITDD